MKQWNGMEWNGTERIGKAMNCLLSKAVNRMDSLTIRLGTWFQ